MNHKENSEWHDHRKSEPINLLDVIDYCTGRF